MAGLSRAGLSRAVGTRCPKRILGGSFPAWSLWPNFVATFCLVAPTGPPRFSALNMAPGAEPVNDMWGDMWGGVRCGMPTPADGRVPIVARMS